MSELKEEIELKFSYIGGKEQEEESFKCHIKEKINNMFDLY